MIPHDNKLKKGDVVYVSKATAPFFARVQIKRRWKDGRGFTVADESWATTKDALEAIGKVPEFQSWGHEKQATYLFLTQADAIKIGAERAQEFLAATFKALEEAQLQANLAARALAKEAV